MKTTSRRAALASIGAVTLAACSGSQHGGSTPSEPAWLVSLEMIVATATVAEPVVCGVITGLLPPAGAACLLVGSTLTLLSDALAGYRAAHGAPSALCAVRAAADAALSARLDVTRMMTEAGIPATPIIAAVAGMLAVAIDALLPSCHAQTDAGEAQAIAMQAPAMFRLRSTMAPGAASSGGIR